MKENLKKNRNRRRVQAVVTIAVVAAAADVLVQQETHIPSG
jgi:tryptophanyl-tRNA synthetase